MIDADTGRLRKTWVFVLTMSWSRHQYVEFVFDQKVETWLRLHRNALSFLGGVPQRIVPDNLKAAVVRGCWGDEPQAQQSYRECAEHYDFLIAPCRPRKPEHKGKVESGVRYVKRNFLGGREPTTIEQANRDVRRWVNTTAGQRVHGTTKEKPLERFEIERQILKPVPIAPYDMAVWKQVTPYRDCYLVFDNAYYSVPFRLVEQKLWVRGGTQILQVYTGDYKLVATHTRTYRPGQRVTHLDHLPPEKVPGLLLSRQTCRHQAAEIGPDTLEVVDRFLDHRPEDRLRTAGRLLQLGDRFGSERLEAACARALRYDDPAYMTIKRILKEGLDAEESPLVAAVPAAKMYVRTATELVGHLLGGVSWR